MSHQTVMVMVSREAMTTKVASITGKAASRSCSMFAQVNFSNKRESDREVLMKKEQKF